ncbi:MAG TPA: MFS transporter [Planctomycetota bacterium]|nr:MFS transporter [Planctomycetota bacterium]
MFARYRADLARISPNARHFLLGSAFMGLAGAIPYTLLTLYLDRLGFNKEQIGATEAAWSWGQVLIALPAAVLLGRLPTRLILVVFGALAGCFGVLLPWAGGFAGIALVAFLGGLSWAVHYVVVAPFLFRNTGSEERGTVFGLVDAVHTTMAVIGSFAAGRLVSVLTERLASETSALAWVISISGLLPLVGVIFYGRIREDAPNSADSTPLLPAIRKYRGTIARFSVPALILGLGSGATVPFLALYFQDRFDFAPGDVGDLFAVAQAFMTTGFLISPLVLRHFGFVRSMVAFEVASIPFFLCLAFTNTLPLAIGAYLLRGALMNSSGPIQRNFMMAAIPEEARTAMNGLQALLWGLGWVIGPWVGGRVLDATGNDYTVLLSCTVVLYGLASCSTWILLKPVERRLSATASEAGTGTG